MLSTPASAWPARDISRERELEHEVDLLARVLDEHGSVSRDELKRLVGAQFWGPGRFRAALREAIYEGRATRRSKSTFGPGS